MSDTPSDWCCVRYDTGDTGPTIVVRERVRLNDTDSSGLIYYGTVTSWLTRAQAELWYSLGFVQEGLGPHPMMPVVNADISYHAPLQLADQYELRGWIAEAGTTSLRVGFDVSRETTVCVTATMTHVHLDPETMRPTPLPQVMIDAARQRR